jgi:hypothetical protein
MSFPWFHSPVSGATEQRIQEKNLLKVNNTNRDETLLDRDYGTQLGLLN